MLINVTVFNPFFLGKIFKKCFKMNAVTLFNAGWALNEQKIM